jgi:hypothetical protein
MSILKWLRQRIVGAADTLVSLDEMALLDEFSMFPVSALVVVGSPERAPINRNKLVDELIEEEAELLSEKSKRWNPKMIRARLSFLKQQEQDRLRSQKVTEWFMMFMYYLWIDHPEMAEYCLFEAQIEAGVIKLQ